MEEEVRGNIDATRPPRRLQPTFWGAGCALAAFLSAIRFVETASGNVPAVLPDAVAATSVGAVIATAALALGAARQGGATRTATDGGAVSLLWVGSIGAIAGSVALFGWYGGALTLAPALSVGLAVLFGGGLAAVAVAWGTLYACLEPEQLLLNGAAALVLTSALHLLHELAGPTGAGWLIVVGLLAASGWCGWRASRYSQPASALPKEVEGDGEAAPAHAAAPFCRALEVLWMPLAGACLSSFIFGLTWDPVVSDERTMNIARDIWGMSIVGPAAMAAAVAVVSARSRGTSPLRLFNQTVYPMAVMLLLVIPVVNQALPDLRLLGNVLSSGSFAVVSLCIWSNMASAVRSVPVSARLVFPAGFLLFALCFAAGLAVIGMVGTHGRTLCLVMLAVYLALMAVSFALDSREEKAALVAERPAGDTRSYIHRRCDEIAKAAGLSPRECDVLYYLGRGYNHTYIAKKLYISENTVRTHVRHIYGKLGISSREELIDLVDGNEPGALGEDALGNREARGR